MAVTRGALFSMSASGAIAKALVYSSWKGISYARSYVIPANPKSTAQEATRGAFRWVHDAYKLSDLEVQQLWTLWAKGQPMTAANAFASHNVGRLIGKTDLTDLIISDGAKGGFPSLTLALTAGSGQIAVAVTNPTMPPGWTQTGEVCAWIADTVPSGEGEVGIKSHTITTPFTTYTITGLLHSIKYWVAVWPTLTKPDGTPAMGGQLYASATTS
jgi:hypothetical protein